MDNLKILFCSSEIVPFAKTGGLADVSGALPPVLEELGLEVRVVMPKYKGIGAKQGRIGKNVPVYFIQNDKYFDRSSLYGEKNGDYSDNLDRFSFFCKEILELIRNIGFKPDVVHCNDWQTALVPIYLKTLYKDHPFYQGIKTILTIHNLAYQGIFPKEQFPKTGLGWELFSIESLEFYGKINLLKGGIVFSDLINTVSPTYAKEIQTKIFGCGLEGILAKRGNSLFGVLNGVDYTIWDSSKDKLIAKNYTKEFLEDKYVNKRDLQDICGLKINEDIPVAGIVSRLADQKGLDLVASVLDDFFKLDMQFVLLGTGDAKYHRIFKKIPKRYGKKISINLRFDEELAHKIYAGSDLFLMPSRYEPCGLGQIISLKYGTIPVVHRVGGLADAVSDYDHLKDNNGWGFTFTELTKESFLEAIKRALLLYQHKESWKKLMRRAMECDFSWKRSALKYVQLYNRCLSLA